MDAYRSGAMNKVNSLMPRITKGPLRGTPRQRSLKKLPLTLGLAFLSRARAGNLCFSFQALKESTCGNSTLRQFDEHDDSIRNSLKNREECAESGPVKQILKTSEPMAVNRMWACDTKQELELNQTIFAYIPSCNVTVRANQDPCYGSLSPKQQASLVAYDRACCPNSEPNPETDPEPESPHKCNTIQQLHNWLPFAAPFIFFMLAYCSSEKQSKSLSNLEDLAKIIHYVRSQNNPSATSFMPQIGKYMRDYYSDSKWSEVVGTSVILGCFVFDRWALQKEQDDGCHGEHKLKFNDGLALTPTQISSAFYFSVRLISTAITGSFSRVSALYHFDYRGDNFLKRCVGPRSTQFGNLTSVELPSLNTSTPVSIIAVQNTNKDKFNVEMKLMAIVVMALLVIGCNEAWDIKNQDVNNGAKAVIMSSALLAAQSFLCQNGMTFILINQLIQPTSSVEMSTI